jgi:hypothetical protein
MTALFTMPYTPQPAPTRETCDHLSWHGTGGQPHFADQCPYPPAS